jgi:hypothetical protein
MHLTPQQRVWRINRQTTIKRGGKRTPNRAARCAHNLRDLSSSTESANTLILGLAPVQACVESDR